MKTYLKKSLTIAILVATFSLCLNFYAITANGEYTQKTKEKECISGRDYDIAIQCMEEGNLTKAIEML